MAVGAQDTIQPPADVHGLAEVEAAFEVDTTAEAGPTPSAPIAAEAGGGGRGSAGEGPLDLDMWFECVEGMFPPVVERASMADPERHSGGVARADDYRLAGVESTYDAGLIADERPTAPSAVSVGSSDLAVAPVGDEQVQLDA